MRPPTQRATIFAMLREAGEAGVTYQQIAERIYPDEWPRAWLCSIQSNVQALRAELGPKGLDVAIKKRRIWICEAGTVRSHGLRGQTRRPAIAPFARIAAPPVLQTSRFYGGAQPRASR